MATPKKVKAIEDLKKEFSGATSIMVSHYAGLTVSEDTELRKQLRAVKVTHKVVKNTLAKRAAAESNLDLKEFLKGPTVISVSHGDIVAPAKVLVNFAKDHEKLQILGGWVEGKPASAADLKAISALPSREELIAKLVMLLNSPIVKLVRTMGGPIPAFARTLQAISDKKAA